MHGIDAPMVDRRGAVRDRPVATQAQAEMLHAIGRAAAGALVDELALAPKPGLVSFVDSGSHADMDAQTFMRSIHALRPYFADIAALGHARAGFDRLQACGQAAETRMLAATGGVNTHRGAVFMLGLLCAGAGALVRDGRPVQPGALREAVQRHWGAALRARSTQSTQLPGDVARRRYGLAGAAHEAAHGFPTLFAVVWPALNRGLERGLAPDAARLDALFHAMAVLDDTNLAHRGGLAGLRHVQRAARGFLDAGGAARPGGRAAAQALHADLVRRHLSPGGAADTLAAACWVQRVRTLADPARAGAAAPCVTA
ncbi:MAG: triphosphoribosyl-dephospho-CoA synthase [Burkholderiaceae bacterium]